MALSLDLAPTVLELAMLPPDAAIQGRSLVPLLRGRASNWRSSFLIEYYTDTVFPRIRNMGYVAVRTERHKYIQYRELTGMNELYDLAADPYEQSNIIDRPEARQVLGRMQGELDQLLRQTAGRVQLPIASLLPERDQRIDRRGAPRGHVGGRERNSQQKRTDGRKDERIGRTDVVDTAAQHTRDRPGGGNPGGDAERGNGHALFYE